MREVGDPLIPYIQEVFRNWNKEQIAQIQEELIRLTGGTTIALKALRMLWVHQIYSGEAVLLILADKKQRARAEIVELDSAYPDIDCEALQRGFREVIFKPGLSKFYIEQHQEEFNFCDRKSSLHDFISEIEELVSEVSGSE